MPDIRISAAGIALSNGKFDSTRKGYLQTCAAGTGFMIANGATVSCVGYWWTHNGSDTNFIATVRWKYRCGAYQMEHTHLAGYPSTAPVGNTPAPDIVHVAVEVAATKAGGS